MADALFSDQRLAVLYDDFDGARDDLDHHERIELSFPLRGRLRLRIAVFG